jgi:formylglycine-generating enzyme required for sulfatase activity
MSPLSFRTLWNETSYHFIELEYFDFFHEIPSMRVVLPEYQIDQVKVTNIRYRTCVSAGVCQPTDREVSEDNDNV